MSSPILHGSVIIATFLTSATIGGGLYEYLVVDPFWPKRPDLIQPYRGGITRGRFWLPVHLSFEVVLILSLVLAWKLPSIRFWLLMALVSHATTRIWSAFYFIPKALAFEKAAAVSEEAARRWTMRSRFRFPIELLTVVLLFEALQATFKG